MDRMHEPNHLRTQLPVPPRRSNDLARSLLHGFGLRSSLIRFKVINALIEAGINGQAMDAHAVHAYLKSRPGGPLFISVREVLKRLCVEQLLCFDQQRGYAFTPRALAFLEMHGGR